MNENISLEEIKFGGELVKLFIVGVAVSAASIVGMYGGLLIVGKIDDMRVKRKFKKAQASEE